MEERVDARGNLRFAGREMVQETESFMDLGLDLWWRELKTILAEA